MFPTRPGRCLPALLSTPLLYLSAAPALGADIDQIQVTATRTPLPLSQTLAPVTVFDRADIERLQARDLFDLLNRAPGISFGRSGGRGAMTSLFLRGSQSNHTLVLIDGVRAGNATSGGTSLELLSPELIERVEIVRGPRSSLYGSEAIGGVINIITRRERGELQPTVRAGIGNNKTREVAASVGGGDERFNFNATVADFYTGGIDHTESRTPPSDDDDAFRQRAIGLSLEHQLHERLVARAFYQDSRSKAEYDTQCLDADTFATVACSPYRRQRLESLAVELEAQVLPAWQARLRYGRSVDDSEERANDIDIGSTINAGEFKTTRTQLHWQNDITLSDDHLLTLGYDFDRDEVSSSVAFEERQRDNDAGYAQLQSHWGIFDSVIGLRRDDNEQFGTHNTGNIALGVDLPGGVRAIASYSEGFKAPTFNDLYFPGFSNPLLEPEESQNVELELRGSHFGTQWAISLFRNDIDHLIQFNPATSEIDQIARARITGAEVSARFTLAGWDAALSATVLDPEDRRSGEELQRRARRYGSIDLDRSFGPWQLGMTVRGEGRRFDGGERLGGYGVVNLRAGYRIDPRWLLQVKVDNLFERRYYQGRDFSLGRYRQPGLEAFLSVTYTP